MTLLQICFWKTF